MARLERGRARCTPPFAVAGGRPRYYADGEDAIIMTPPSLGDAEFGRLRERLRRQASAEAQQRKLRSRSSRAMG